MREITCWGMSCPVSDSIVLELVLVLVREHAHINPFFLHHIPAIKPISHSVSNRKATPKTLELDTIEVCALWQQMNDNQPENWVQHGAGSDWKGNSLCLSCVWPQHVQSFKWIQQLNVVLFVVGQLEWVFQKMPQCNTEITHTQCAPIEVSMGKLICRIELNPLLLLFITCHAFFYDQEEHIIIILLNKTQSVFNMC